MKINYLKPSCFNTDVTSGAPFLQASGIAGDLSNNPFGRIDDGGEIIL